MDQGLATVIEKYERYPQFLGIEITDVNQRAAMNDTMLHFAAELGSTEDIDVLVTSGAEVNAVGDIGNTPLHGAALMGKVAAARRLLELGANPTLRNELGHHCQRGCRAGGKRRRCFDLCVELGRCHLGYRRLLRVSLD
jgi:ankyrin repeat protein